MKLIDSNEGLAIAVTLDELRLIACALGEALEAVDEWEFSTRLGFESPKARVLRSEINEVSARSPEV